MQNVLFQHLSTSKRPGDQDSLLFYGRTQEGKSVCINVTNVKPYGYIDKDELWWQDHGELIQNYVKFLATKKFMRFAKKKPNAKKRTLNYYKNMSNTIHIEGSKGFGIRNVFEGRPRNFMKITASNTSNLRHFIRAIKHPNEAYEELKSFHSELTKACDLIQRMDEKDADFQKRCEEDARIPFCICSPTWNNVHLFETHIPHELVYMIDHELPCCGWIMAKGIPDELRTTCHIELTCTASMGGEIQKASAPIPMAPYKVLSYDIEAQPHVVPGQTETLFPKPERDPVLCIGVCVFNMVDQDIKQYNFVYEPITNTTYEPLSEEDQTDEFRAETTKVYSFTNEYDMLLAFNDFIRKEDPDIITGYNILNFDNVYTIKRAKHLYKEGDLKAWCWGRNERECSLKSQYKFSNQKGGKETWECNIEGREFFDLYKIIMDDHKLRSYKLDEVASTFLGTRKIHIAYNDIPKLQRTIAGRMKLGVYCVKDAWLPCKIAIKMAKVLNAILMSQVTGVTLNTILNRGQQIRTITLMLQKCKQRQKQGHTRWFLPDEDDAPDTGSFEGAVVITPKPGFYDQPVATLDFASLYPSIMRAYNMCFSTIIASPSEAKSRGYEWSEDMERPTYRPVRTFSYPEGGKFEYLNRPDDVCFITAEKRKGILPEILEELLTERKLTKKQMKKHHENSMDYAVCNGRQLALKVCANSVYGFTGASKGYLPDKRIASSVTRAGRGMANISKFMCEDKYKDYGVQVVYGDTDSIFVHLPKKICSGDTKEAIIERANELAEEMAEMCNKAFLPPNDLEFEKVYYPLLLKGKKRYAGYKFEPGLKPKLDVKGFECVRRDFAPIVSKTQKKIFVLLCEQNNVKAAVQFARQTVVDLLEGRVPIEDLILSKQLTRPPDQYKNPSPHVELAKRLQRTLPPTQAPKTGDRIDYVIRPGREKMFLRSVQPQEVSEGKYSVDTKWYLENQLKEPLKRVFDMIMENTMDIFRINRFQLSAIGSNSMFSKFVLKKHDKPVARVAEEIKIKRKKANQSIVTRKRKVTPRVTPSNKMKQRKLDINFFI